MKPNRVYDNRAGPDCVGPPAPVGPMDVNVSPRGAMILRGVISVFGGRLRRQIIKVQPL